jgi:hypothetical protein
MPHPDQVSTENLTSVARQVGNWLDQSAAEKFRAAGQGANPPAGPPNFSESSSPSASDAGLPPAATPPPFELGESFAVYSLGAEYVEKGPPGGADLAQLARKTGRWHHQIKVGKKPVGFARSTGEGDAAVELQQIYVSDLAKYVDEAITWLDAYEEQNPNGEAPDPVVRLLVVPAYQVHAFWLCDPRAEGEPPSGASRTPAKAESGAWGYGGESRVLVIDAPPHLDGLRPNALLGSGEFLEAFRGKEQFGGLIFT